MFDNLNNSNQSNGQPGNEPVDDIFAQTDKVADEQNKPNGSDDIVTRRVGLTASTPPSSLPGPGEEEKKTNKGFMVAVIVMVVVIVALLGFLAYSKFFKTATVEENTVNTNKVGEENKSDESETVATTTADSNTEEPLDLIIDIPDGIEEIASTTDIFSEETASTTSAFVASSIDSDNDGLTDEEEILAQTNINLIDTDNDGLGDYEEVIIYKTNPLVADTDEDGYSDGEEVSGGYNPNGDGKLPGNK